MTLARSVHACAVLCGLAVVAVAGAVLGDAWWLAAALAGAGALTGRVGALVHAVATLALVGGAAAADATWLVPLLVLGLFASVEASAVPARITRVRPRASVAPAAVTALTAGAVSAVVLALSELGPGFAVPTALTATLAAAALLTALRA